MWVQLKCIKYIEKNGKEQAYHPGDWVNVHRQHALRWIAAGEAISPDPSTSSADIDYSAGILALVEPGEEFRSRLAEIPQLQFTVGPIGLPYSETLIWHPSVVLKLGLLSVGFRLLEKWQMAVPLLDYKTLALNVGSEAEREETKAMIHDLRVPIRDPRLMFLRRCDATRQLINIYAKDIETGKHPQLSLLRAIWQVKPVVCDLPNTWIV